MTRGGAALSSRDPPVLVCADLQAQYLAEDRFAGSEAERCLALLELWRTELWPVLHLKRIAQAAWFDPASNLTDWGAVIRPQPGEMVFEHPLPSAYSSARFAEYTSNIRNIRCVVMGFSLDETILSTVIEGFHRSHRYEVIEDAVACRHTGVDNAASYKSAVVRVIGNFAGIRHSADLIGASGRMAI